MRIFFLAYEWEEKGDGGGTDIPSSIALILAPQLQKRDGHKKRLFLFFLPNGDSGDATTKLPPRGTP